MRCCARWNEPRARGSATTGGRPGSNFGWKTSRSCSGDTEMRKAVLFLPLLLMACSEPELSPEQREAAEERAIAAVEAAQIIPPEPVTPEPILFADIERYDLFGAGCSFLPRGEAAEAPDGAGVLALTSESGAYIKVEGELHRLAPDAGSPQLPLGTRGKYDGREFALILDIA